jgi:DNA-binding CsgD family transcriptional regulator
MLSTSRIDEEGLHSLPFSIGQPAMINRVGNVLLDLHCGCRQQTAEGFMRWAMALIRQAIPCDAWFWGSGSEIAGEIIVHTFQFDNVPLESMQTWEHYKHLDSFAAALMEKPNVVLNVTYEMLKTTEIYRLLHHPVGVEQMLAIYAYKPSCGLYDGITLYRSDPEAPFSEEERQAMQCLAPHLIEARHINYLEHLSSAMQRAPQRYSVAASDGKGVLHVVGAGFVELMRAEWPQWQGPCLPEALLKPITAATRHYFGQSITVRFVPVSDMFLLKVCPHSLVDDLSTRELEIARHFAEGLSNKELARKLGLSPSTVRNHLSSIYFKLGVGGKAELATLLSAWAAD